MRDKYWVSDKERYLEDNAFAEALKQKRLEQQLEYERVKIDMERKRIDSDEQARALAKFLVKQRRQKEVEAEEHERQLANLRRIKEAEDYEEIAAVGGVVG